jgi:hypothetical protein
VVSRLFSWSLLWSGLAAIGAFLGTMPAFLVHGSRAFAGEGKDILFGVRQYGTSGWIGVVRESDAQFYAERLWQSFGAPALLLGVAGLLAAPRALRARVAWLLPFPVVYLLLLGAMSMSVRRNLLPVLPWLALLLGIGAASLSGRVGALPVWTRSPAAARRVALTVLVVVVLLVPVRATVEQDLRYTRASTGEAAIEWIAEHVPPGARIVKESYTPRFDGLPYAVLQSRFAARRPLAEIRDPANDFLLLSWSAHGRFLREELLTQPHHRVYWQRYSEMLGWEKVREFAPGRTRLGPYLSLFRLEPEGVELASARVFEATEVAFVSPPLHAVPGSAGSESSRRATVEIASTEGFVLFKGHFVAGRYRLAATGGDAGPRGRIEVRSRDGAVLGEGELESGAVKMVLPEPGKYFFYLRLAPGSTLERFEVSRVEPSTGG